MNSIDIKRIYNVPSDTDGYRVLIDRVWLRGISKKMQISMNGIKKLLPL